MARAAKPRKAKAAQAAHPANNIPAAGNMQDIAEKKRLENNRKARERRAAKKAAGQAAAEAAKAAASKPEDGNNNDTEADQQRDEDEIESPRPRRRQAQSGQANRPLTPPEQPPVPDPEFTKNTNPTTVASPAANRSADGNYYIVQTTAGKVGSGAQGGVYLATGADLELDQEKYPDLAAKITYPVVTELKTEQVPIVAPDGRKLGMKEKTKRVILRKNNGHMEWAKNEIKKLNRLKKENGIQKYISHSCIKTRIILYSTLYHGSVADILKHNHLEGLYNRKALTEEKWRRRTSLLWECWRSMLHTLNSLREKYGIAHQDIKFENVLYKAKDVYNSDPNGLQHELEFFLGDFGIAQTQHHDAERKGSYMYYASELRDRPMGIKGKVTCASDMWSLFITFYAEIHFKKWKTLSDRYQDDWEWETMPWLTSEEGTNAGPKQRGKKGKQPPKVFWFQYVAGQGTADSELLQPWKRMTVRKPDKRMTPQEALGVSEDTPASSFSGKVPGWWTPEEPDPEDSPAGSSEESRNIPSEEKKNKRKRTNKEDGSESPEPDKLSKRQRPGKVAEKRLPGPIHYGN